MKEYHFLPEGYDLPCKQPGTLTITEYEYSGVNKQALIYLPYEYDISKPYDFVYLMHGGGANIDRLFGGIEASRPLKNTIDHMIQNNDIQPMIIVCPTYFGTKEGSDEELVKIFHQEVPYMIQGIEGKYGSYYKQHQDLFNTRSHRAFGGYSMGAVTTYWMFLNALEYFQYFLPMSGECWATGKLGGGKEPDKTAKILANHALAKKLPFHIEHAVGTTGIAYANVFPQIQAMYKLYDVFNEDTLAYYESPYIHDSIYANEYLYNILPNIFKS